MTQRQATVPSSPRSRALHAIDPLAPRAGTIIPEAGAPDRKPTAPAVIVDPLALVPEPGVQDPTLEVLDGWKWPAGRHDTIADAAAPLRVRRYAITGVASIAVGVALALGFAARSAPRERVPAAALAAIPATPTAGAPAAASPAVVASAEAEVEAEVAASPATWVFSFAFAE